MNPVNDRTSRSVFISEDWKEFADWCLHNDVRETPTPIFAFNCQHNKATNVNTFNDQFCAIKADGLYKLDSDSEIWCLTILMLCAAIEAGDTFISPKTSRTV